MNDEAVCRTAPATQGLSIMTGIQDHPNPRWFVPYRFQFCFITELQGLLDPSSCIWDQWHKRYQQGGQQNTIEIKHVFLSAQVMGISRPFIWCNMVNDYIAPFGGQRQLVSVGWPAKGTLLTVYVCYGCIAFV